MAEIVYKPHCSACGALITDEVSYIPKALTYFNDGCLRGIRPYKCSKCGRDFSSISPK